MQIETLFLIPAVLATIFSSMALSQGIGTNTFPFTEQAPATVASFSSQHTVSALLAESLRASGERLESADKLKNSYRHTFFKDINREISTDAA